MANITEKIERQITALEGKIDALSGNYLTNTWKRQREQQERDRKKEMYHSQIQVLQFLKQKSETDTLTHLMGEKLQWMEQNGVTGYEKG